MFALPGFYFMFVSFLCVFYGQRDTLLSMSQCTRQSTSSSKFAWFSCTIFLFVLAAYFKLLDKSNVLLFQVKISNFSS